MKFLRNRRRAAAAAVGACAFVIGTTLGIVVPALGSTANDYVAPPSQAGVLPKDVAIGGTGDCANLFSNLGGNYSEYDNVNPKTASNLASGNKDGATFALSVSGSSKNQTLAVNATGAEILGIGIKGGTQSTAYDYVNGPYVTGSYPYTPSSGSGSVTSDSALHAPAQSFSSKVTGIETVEQPTQYYTISQLTVCYKQGSVSGTVYQDTNVDGTYEPGTDSTLSGWTIHLYDSSHALVGTATSSSSGAYRIGAAFDGNAYTVCEVPNPSTPFPAGDNAWAQTEPGAGSATCTGAGELKRGFSITPTALDNVTENFGNVGAIKCTSAPFGIPGYQVGTCKPTQTYVFSSGTVSGQPYVSYWVGDPTQGAVPTVEKITFDDPWSGGPQFTKILYEDSNGFQEPSTNAPQMPYCNVDPRNTTAAGYPDSYTLLSPAPADILPGAATSCLISLKISAPAGASANGTLVAYVYSTTDSFRMGS